MLGWGEGRDWAQVLGSQNESEAFLNKIRKFLIRNASDSFGLPNTWGIIESTEKNSRWLYPALKRQKNPLTTVLTTGYLNTVSELLSKYKLCLRNEWSALILAKRCAPSPTVSGNQLQHREQIDRETSESNLKLDSGFRWC